MWGLSNKTQVHRVQKLQNFAAKVVHGSAKKFDHVTPIIKDLKWLTVEQQCKVDMCSFIYKVQNDKIPNWLISLPTIGQINERDTRQRNDLYIPPANTEIGSRVIEIRGSSAWNRLSTNIKSSSSLIKFKKQLKEHILRGL